MLGLSAGLIVAAARQAGDLVAAQAGLSASAFFDPELGLELTPLGHLYGLIAVAVFLILDGPLILVGTLLDSYKAIPVDSFALSEAAVYQAFYQVGGALILALRAAAPVVIGLTVAGITLGWLARLAPALSLMALSLPIRSILGIILVFVGLATLAATLSEAWGHWPWSV
jgi:flagellar biosynthesis protein FliR